MKGLALGLGLLVTFAGCVAAVVVGGAREIVGDVPVPFAASVALGGLSLGGALTAWVVRTRSAPASRDAARVTGFGGALGVLLLPAIASAVEGEDSRWTVGRVVGTLAIGLLFCFGSGALVVAALLAASDTSGVVHLSCAVSRVVADPQGGTARVWFHCAAPDGSSLDGDIHVPQLREAERVDAPELKLEIDAVEGVLGVWFSPRKRGRAAATLVFAKSQPAPLPVAAPPPRPPERAAPSLDELRREQAERARRANE